MDFHGHESSEVCPACAAPLPDRDGRRVCLRCLVRVSLDGTKEEVRTLAHSDLRPGDQIGEYELLEVIGRGGMGVVFRARQIRLGRVVAVKTLKDDRLFMPQDIRRFRTEAEALAGLRHPHIVGIHELLEAEGRQFLVMEYVPGPTLTEWSRQQPLAAEIAARFVSKLAV
ncbi:MAG TPA: hypothetical protein DCE44_20500, partial [Verrucomicrobiales bacterium]|nr:hypothetical protein [Verrucomicrobiales bacterium]